MTTYKVLSPMGVTIHTGRVKLTKDQHRRRVHAVAAVAGAENIYEVKSPIAFKCGEEFGYDGVISKAMATELADAATGKPVVQLRAEKEAVEKAAKGKKDAEQDQAKGKGSK